MVAGSPQMCQYCECVSQHCMRRVGACTDVVRQILHLQVASDKPFGHAPGLAVQLQSELLANATCTRISVAQAHSARSTRTFRTIGAYKPPELNVLGDILVNSRLHDLGLNVAFGLGEVDERRVELDVAAMLLEVLLK